MIKEQAPCSQHPGKTEAMGIVSIDLHGWSHSLAQLRKDDLQSRGMLVIFQDRKAQYQAWQTMMEHTCMISLVLYSAQFPYPTLYVKDNEYLL